MYYNISDSNFAMRLDSRVLGSSLKNYWQDLTTSNYWCSDAEKLHKKRLIVKSVMPFGTYWVIWCWARHV